MNAETFSPFKKHCLLAVFIFEFNGYTLDALGDSLGVFKVDSATQCVESNGAVKRAGIDIDKAERLSARRDIVLLPAPAGPSIATFIDIEIFLSCFLY